MEIEFNFEKFLDLLPEPRLTNLNLLAKEEARKNFGRAWRRQVAGWVVRAGGWSTTKTK